MTTRTSRSGRRLVALAVAAATALAACGGDDETSDDSAATEQSVDDSLPDDGANTDGDDDVETAADPDAATTTVATTVAEADEGADDAYDGPVTELAIRRVLPEVEIDGFSAARDTLVETLTAQPGVGTDREFEAFLDGATFTAPSADVFTGMTEYENIGAFEAAAVALSDSADASAFGAMFEPEVFTALRPKDPSDRYELAEIAPEPGQVLEIAVRDLSTYDDFDEAAYETTLATFLDTLSEQPGFVAEYQWVSVLDPDIAVGMTVYDSADAFFALSQNAALLEAAGPFIGAYPTIAGYIHEDARRTTVPGEADDGSVIQLGVRQPNDLDEWRTSLAAINAQIGDFPAITGLAEYEPIFSAAPIDAETGEGVSDLYFTLISVTSEADFNDLQAQLGQNPSPEAIAFQSTFTPLLNINIQPYRDTRDIDVEELLQPGEVLEIAVRDVRGYDSFEDFDAVREAAVAELTAQPGVIEELEFRSTDGNYYVGMTRYASVEDFEAVAAGLADPSPALQALFAYPPDINQFGITFNP